MKLSIIGTWVKMGDVMGGNSGRVRTSIWERGCEGPDMVPLPITLGIGVDVWGGWKLGVGGADAPCGGAKFVLLPISQPR